MVKPHMTGTPAVRPASWLWIWMGDKDGKQDDFLAVVDVRDGSRTYGQVVATQPVGLRNSMPHHFEYELPPAGELLWANAHNAEKLLLSDFSDPEHPRVVRMLSPPPPYRYPHDMTRLDNGHVLVGFLRSEGPSPAPNDPDLPGNPGGIAEYDAHGDLIRTASAAVSGLGLPVRTYAMLPLTDIDRLVTTSAVMMETSSADVVQVWRLSTLELLHTMTLPPAYLPDGRLQMGKRGIDTVVGPSGHRLPFEPRRMADGSVLMNAYGCGFYRLTDLAAAHPQVRNVYTIEVPNRDHLAGCGIPVVVNHYWLMPVAGLHAVVTLDISNPDKPIESSRLVVPRGFQAHWLAKDPGSNRLVLGQEVDSETSMLMLTVDPSNGRLFLDDRARSPDGSIGIVFKRDLWPHGASGEATGHAALFVPGR
jgi:hypothetical protein